MRTQGEHSTVTVRREASGGASPAYRAERKYQQTPRVCAAQPVVFGGRADRSAVTPFRSICSTGAHRQALLWTQTLGARGSAGVRRGRLDGDSNLGQLIPGSRLLPTAHPFPGRWEVLPCPWLRAEERTLPALSGPGRPRSLLPWAGHVFICSVTSPTWMEHLLCPRCCEGGGEREPSGSSHSGETD